MIQRAVCHCSKHQVLLSTMWLHYPSSVCEILGIDARPCMHISKSTHVRNRASFVHTWQSIVRFKLGKQRVNTTGVQNNMISHQHACPTPAIAPILFVNKPILVLAHQVAIIPQRRNFFYQCENFGQRRIGKHMRNTPRSNLYPMELFLLHI